MGLFAKDQQADASRTSLVTGAEFDAFMRVVAIAFTVTEEASKYGNVSGAQGSARARLGKVAARPDLFNLSEAEQDVLHALRALIDEAFAGESQREHSEEQARGEANGRPPKLWNDDGSYARRIPFGSR